MRDSEYIIYGRNPVIEAIRAGKTIDRLFLQDKIKGGAISTLIREARKREIPVDFVTKERLDNIIKGGRSGTEETVQDSIFDADQDNVRDTDRNSVRGKSGVSGKTGITGISHQGVVAYFAAARYYNMSELLEEAENKGEAPFLILLDGIEDPHNLGAIIRTANLCGAHGVIIPKRRAAGLTGAAAKASAGAINYTKVCRTDNMTQCIKTLKEKGLWIVCADQDGDSMYSLDLKGPIALVIGAEGTGVSRLVKENCDFLAAIPMSPVRGRIGSLNASVSCGILAFEILHQRTG